MAYGDYLLTTLTAKNVDDLSVERDHRADSERVTFLVKTRLTGKEVGRAALERIEHYIESVPEVGRAQMEEWGTATLSIVGPDSYRQQIAAKIAEDSRVMAAQMGDGYLVEVKGMNMPVQWSQSGPSEVFLYIPYTMKIVPKP